MLAALQMPQWLVDFWTVYGDMITPVLVTLLTSIVTWLALKIRSDAKVNRTKAELQIEALKEVANREDNKPQLDAQSEQIADLTKVIMYLADMVDVAFQNSDLDPEIKSNLSSLVNKIKYGTEEDLVKELEASNAKLKEQIETLTNALAESAKQSVEAAVTETKTRTRR